MRVLFDQGTPDPLRKSLPTHDVATTYERGWSTLTNGELLVAAEREGYEVFVTTDTNLKYQQDLISLRLRIVVLLSTSWPRIQRVIPSIAAAIDRAVPGSYSEIEIPDLEG